MYKAVIFDMDGVLIHSEPVYLALIDKIYEELGVTLTEEEKLTALGGNANEWWAQIIQRFGLTATTEELVSKEKAGCLRFLESPEAANHLFDGMTDTIKALKARGYKLAVASASPESAIAQVIAHAGLENTFDALVSTWHDAVKHGKPAPDVFLYAAECLGEEPENCMVVEDSTRGIAAGKAAGMPVIAFLSAPGEIDTSQADYAIHDYSEFFSVPLFI